MNLTKEKLELLSWNLMITNVPKDLWDGEEVQQAYTARMEN
jgi:hypothetical protein